jgi:drug/metabolite transporter (DMT)-like permease
MTWLVITISAYLVLAIVFLIDKHLLESGIPSPALYAFYTGILSSLIFLLAPFVDFFVPSLSNFLLACLVGALFIVALFWFYKALRLFEASRVVPVVGALSPIFSFVIAFFFAGAREEFFFLKGLAFFFLVSGSFFIALERTKVSWKSFVFSSVSAFFFSLFFILQKNLFQSMNSFWNSLIWMSVGSFLVALFFFAFFKETRQGVSLHKKAFDKKTAFLFFVNKAFSGLGGLMQRWAVFLTPGFIEVPLVQGLQGIQYAFLFLLTLVFSRRFPTILKEEISKKIVLKKSLAIAMITIGLALLIIFEQ